MPARRSATLTPMPATPTLDEYVNAFLMGMRAQPTERTAFTSAGRHTERTTGERILYGPKGEKIRVLEDENRNTQVEVGDQLHGVARPQPQRLKVSLAQAQAIASALGRPGAINATMTPQKAKGSPR